MSVNWKLAESFELHKDAPERRDSLLAAMLGVPPITGDQFIGKTVRAPKKTVRPVDKTKPEGFQIPEGTLLSRISAALPPGGPEWRDDLMQNLAVAILSGEITEDELNDKLVIKRYRMAVMNEINDRITGKISLHQRMYRDQQPIGDLLVGAEDVDMPDE